MSIKDSVLQALTENKGSFISGEELSKNMEVSRTAVWKAIKTLREEGYPIEAVTNRGYKLAPDKWLITEDTLKLALPAKYKNNRLYIYDTLDSTNIRAKQLALENAPHGTVVIARQQTAGRGRLGRSFFSPRDGIYISIIVRPDFDLTKSVHVTSAASVAVAESIESICGMDAKIKWVNDIYADNKKVCGILTEGITDFETGQIESLVIGIGVNTTIKDFPEDLLELLNPRFMALTGSSMSFAKMRKIGEQHARQQLRKHHPDFQDVTLTEIYAAIADLYSLPPHITARVARAGIYH